ncbi:MAG TPA: cysteine--tRNA ligase, partial [Clostridium sp.]|nr:cysteine--tRNA ligase [Clostridium sp.]
DKVFSLDLMTIEKEVVKVDEKLINALIEERNVARKEKNYKRSDEIRAQLLEMTIEVLDSKEGTTWRVK